MPGKTVELTIDAALQDEVEQVLAGVGAKYSPKGATAIAMNPNTGAILALANWPRVNANDPSAAPSYATEDRAVGFNYEPGSTFKAITVAGALQDGRGHAEHAVQRAAGPAGRRPPDPRRREPRLRDAVGRPDPQGLEQHRRRPDRDEARRQAVRLLGAPVRLRLAHRASTSPASRAASSCAGGSTRGRRWATCRSARASR